MVLESRNFCSILHKLWPENAITEVPLYFQRYGFITWKLFRFLTEKHIYSAKKCQKHKVSVLFTEAWTKNAKLAELSILFSKILVNSMRFTEISHWKTFLIAKSGAKVGNFPFTCKTWDHKHKISCRFRFILISNWKTYLFDKKWCCNRKI